MDLQWRDTEPTAEERKAHEERGGVWLMRRGGAICPIIARSDVSWQAAWHVLASKEAAYAPVGVDYQAVEWPEAKPEWVQMAEDAIGVKLRLSGGAWRSDSDSSSANSLYWVASLHYTGALSIMLCNKNTGGFKILEMLFGTTELASADPQLSIYGRLEYAMKSLGVKRP